MLLLGLKNLATLIVGYSFLLATSGWVVQKVLTKAAEEFTAQEINNRVRYVGAVIGKCENILILTFMILEAYTALAIVFTAKAIVREKEMEQNPLYFLVGTMVNVTYSVLVGFLLKILISRSA